MMLHILGSGLFSLLLALFAFVTKQNIFLWLMYGVFALTAGLIIRLIRVRIGNLARLFARGGTRSIMEGRGWMKALFER